jgi:hypothetical protein
MVFLRKAETVTPRLTQFRREALGIATHALRAIPSIAVEARPIAVWALAAIFLGLIVGFSAVILPPAGAFIVPGLAGLGLLWVMPELDIAAEKSIRTLFFIVLVVDLCVPNYYAIAGIGLPWISVRRLATFPLIVTFALAISTSSAARARVSERLGSAKVISICVIGFAVMIGLSFLSSENPSTSLSGAVDASFNWFAPFFLTIYVFRDEDDIELILRVIAWCSIFVSLIGVADFIAQHRLAIDILPKFMVNALMENNPTFQTLVNHADFRLGQYRASSIFGNALSFGEFAAMVVPFGYFFLLHGNRQRDRLLGISVVVTGFLALLTANSRGAFLSLIVATPVFVFLWAIRSARFNRGSMVPIIVLAAGAIASALLFGSVFFWPRIHDKVLGGAAEQASTQARWDEWHLAIPHIIANPVTGHGFDGGATVVGYYNIGSLFPTLDSYIISLLVETGIPGLLFFFGSVIAGILLGARGYVSDPSRRGAISGALACSLVSFAVYRIVLSQRENHTLFFLFLASIVALIHVKGRMQPKSLKEGYFNPKIAVRR